MACLNQRRPKWPGQEPTNKRANHQVGRIKANKDTVHLNTASRRLPSCFVGNQEGLKCKHTSVVCDQQDRKADRFGKEAHARQLVERSARCKVAVFSRRLEILVCSSLIDRGFRWCRHTVKSDKIKTTAQQINWNSKTVGEKVADQLYIYQLSRLLITEVQMGVQLCSPTNVNFAPKTPISYGVKNPQTNSWNSLVYEYKKRLTPLDCRLKSNNNAKSCLLGGVIDSAVQWPLRQITIH